MDCYQALPVQRYLIKLESGLIICQNRIHLCKRLTSCATEHHNHFFHGTDPGNKEDGSCRTRQAFNQNDDGRVDASPRRSRRMSWRPSRFIDLVIE